MPRQFAKVNIEISSICNLQCSFCPEVVREKKVMSPEDFRRVISQVAAHTKLVALHLMGDPLVHPQLSEIVSLCAEHHVRIFFVTNGLLLKEKEAELLLDPTFRQVNFSLHSFVDNFGRKDMTQYLDRIFRFTEAAFERRPTLFINYRLWNLSDPQGREENNLEVLRRIEERFGVRVDPNVDTRLKKSQHLTRHLYLHFDTEFTWPAMDLPLQGEKGTCYGLDSHFGVLVDGTVVPCCLDKEAEIALGNLHREPLTQILKGPRATQMRQGFKAHRLVEALCQRCTYIERFA